MADDDLESGRPRSGNRASKRGPPLGFSQFVTLSLSLLLVGVLVCLSMPATEDARVALIERPTETVERVFERNLWIEDAVGTLPPWTQGAVAALIEMGGSTREEAIEAFGDVLRNNGYPRQALDRTETPVDSEKLHGLRARHAVLLAESGRIEEAQGDLQELTAAGRASFVDAVRRAYSRVRSDDTRTFAAYDVSIAGDDWIGKRLQLRLAMAAGSPELRAEIERTIRERREQFAGRLRTIVLLAFVPLGLGLLVLLAWLGRNRPPMPTSSAEIPPPWSFQDGYAVVVRSAFFAIGIAFVLRQLSEWLDMPAVRSWSALLVSLPMLWLVRKRLVLPLGLTFRSAFGLTHFSRPLAWIGFVLALFAIDQLGTHLIVDLFRLAGVGLHWTEGFDPSALRESKGLVLFESIDTCVWAPIFEELGFRGLLYATLRRHYKPWQAALLSGALFGAAHLHSLPGLASVTWKGFVYALAFERCRSIVPGIVCHAWTNAIAVAATWCFFR